MKNILMLLFASFAMIACGGEDDKKDRSSESTDRWSDSDKSKFRDVYCKDGKDLCDCMLSEISKNYSTYEEFHSKYTF